MVLDVSASLARSVIDVARLHDKLSENEERRLRRYIIQK